VGSRKNAPDRGSNLVSSAAGNCSLTRTYISRPEFVQFNWLRQGLNKVCPGWNVTGLHREFGPTPRTASSELLVMRHLSKSLTLVRCASGAVGCVQLGCTK